MEAGERRSGMRPTGEKGKKGGGGEIIPPPPGRCSDEVALKEEREVDQPRKEVQLGRSS